MTATDHTIPESSCPFCGATMSGACNLFGEEGPSPGDFTICIECEAVLTFDQGYHLRAATDAELKEIASDPRLKRIIDAFAAVKKQEGRNA